MHDVGRFVVGNAGQGLAGTVPSAPTRVPQLLTTAFPSAFVRHHSDLLGWIDLPAPTALGYLAERGPEESGDAPEETEVKYSNIPTVAAPLWCANLNRPLQSSSVFWPTRPNLTTQSSQRTTL